MADASGAPVDPRAPHDFTPEHYGDRADAPVYRIKPATLLERIAFRAALTEAAGQYPGDAALIAAMREAIGQIEADRDTAAQILSDYEAALAARDAALKARLPAEDVPAVAPELAEAFARLLGLCEVSDVVRAILAARERRLMTSLYLGAQRFLAGWSGADLPRFRRERAGVPAALLDALPEEDVLACGAKALALMAPTEPQLGNSASPRPSPAGPAISPKGPSPAAPADGSCSEPPTTSTPPG